LVDAYDTITNSVTVESVERNGRATVDELETRVTFLYEALGGDASGVRTGCVPGSNWAKPPKPVIAGEWFRVRGRPAYVTSLPDGGPRGALLPPGTLRQRRVVGVAAEYAYVRQRVNGLLMPTPPLPADAPPYLRENRTTEARLNGALTTVCADAASAYRTISTHQARSFVVAGTQMRPWRPCVTLKRRALQQRRPSVPLRTRQWAAR
jgi:hypothetical protein